MDPTGHLGMYVCVRTSANTGSYNIASDVMRWRLYLKPTRAASRR